MENILLTQHDRYIADDRFSTVEYLESLRNMTPEEFEQHIKTLKGQNN